MSSRFAAGGLGGRGRWWRVCVGPLSWLLAAGRIARSPTAHARRPATLQPRAARLLSARFAAASSLQRVWTRSLMPSPPPPSTHVPGVDVGELRQRLLVRLRPPPPPPAEHLLHHAPVRFDLVQLLEPLVVDLDEERVPAEEEGLDLFDLRPLIPPTYCVTAYAMGTAVLSHRQSVFVMSPELL